MKHFALCLKRFRTISLTKDIMLNSSTNYYCMCILNKHALLSYCISNGLLLLKSFEKRGAQKSCCFENYSRANQIAGSCLS